MPVFIPNNILYVEDTMNASGRSVNNITMRVGESICLQSQEYANEFEETEHEESPCWYSENPSIITVKGDRLIAVGRGIV